METCKDCLHYDICTFHITGNENKRCCHFKNKADVVEVVRCKDCALWHSPMNDDRHYCGLKFGMSGLVAEEDFCSYGERKEGAGDDL